MEGKRRGRYERRVKKKKENKWKEMREDKWLPRKMKQQE